MGGGSWDYAYMKIEEVGKKLTQCACPYRRALGGELIRAALAVHDIEWVDSGDYADGEEMETIKKALGGNCEKKALRAVIFEAEDAMQALKNQIIIADDIARRSECQ